MPQVAAGSGLAVVFARGRRIEVGAVKTRLVTLQFSSANGEKSPSAEDTSLSLFELPKFAPSPSMY